MCINTTNSRLYPLGHGGKCWEKSPIVKLFVAINYTKNLTNQILIICEHLVDQTHFQIKWVLWLYFTNRELHFTFEIALNLTKEQCKTSYCHDYVNDYQSGKNKHFEISSKKKTHIKINSTFWLRVYKNIICKQKLHMFWKQICKSYTFIQETWHIKYQNIYFIYQFYYLNIFLKCIINLAKL